MRGNKFILSSLGVTVASILFLCLSGKVSLMQEYVNVVGELTSIENESELLEINYTQQSKILAEKGVITNLEDLEQFNKNLENVSVKEVAVLKFIGENEELIAVVPSLVDAFSIESGDMLRITYAVNSDMSEALSIIKVQKMTYKEMKIIPLNNEIQITFLI